jgi:hypothetical protein
MANGFSKGDLFEFLDFTGRKGLGSTSMVAGRKAAVNALLGVLSDDEAKDVRSLDLDEVAQRFMNLRGTDFKPASIQVYRSRVQSAINDFVRYRQDPIGFKPSGGQVKRASTTRSEKIQNPDAPQAANNASFATSTNSIPEITFPVPIRPGIVVRLIGIPDDLSRKEAERISNVILALAQSDGE